MGRLVAAWLVVAALAATACVDVEGGERGSYSSPCTGPFSQLGLCGRGTGGAPPTTDPSKPDGPFTCADACELLCSCGLCDDPGDLQQCTQGCQEDPASQAVLDCLERNGCNFDACF